jgi:hypothetical protein
MAMGGRGVQSVDIVVQIVRQEPGSLTRDSLRGKTERMIEIVTSRAAADAVVVVLTKRVAD